MKKTLKLLVPLLIGAAFAFSFASCSSDDGDGGNQQYYDDNSWDKNVDLFVGHKNLGTNWDSDLALILDGALFSNCNSSDKFTLDFEFESADYYKLKICANIDDWPELKSIVLPAGMYLDEYYGGFDVNSSPLTFSLNSSDLTAIKQSGMVIQGHGVIIKKVSYQPSNSLENGNVGNQGGSGNTDDSSGNGNNENAGNSGSGSSSEDASGLYLGIIKFADDVVDLNNGKLVHLNSQLAKDDIKNSIEYNYSTAEDMATLMYYGVHTALVNLKNNESSLPDDLKNVYIITFTDGLDNSSASMAKDHPLENNTGLSGKFTTDQYAEWLKEQLLTHKVKGNDIVCHSIGVKGSDMRDENGFKDALNYVATSSNDAHVLTDFDKVQSTFEELAKNLTITTYTYNFDLILPSNAWESDVCMTFDIQDYQNIESAQIKFYGKITPSDVDDKEYTFEINEYSGIKPSSMKIIGREIPSIKNPNLSKLQFLFENISCDESYESSSIPVWLSNSLAWRKTKNGVWDLNSEYNPEESNKKNTSRSSAVIYLVLDNSFSLGTDISEVRNAVLNFIDTLYEKLPKNIK